MDMIELAREIGRQLQKDESYLNMQAVSKECDKDEELQNLIGEFNLKRMGIDNESHKESPDQDKLQLMNQELRQLYARILQNSNMTRYNEAKQGVDKLLNRVSAIISKSADGEDPETADYEESCGGNCGSCGGCH